MYMTRFIECFHASKSLLTSPGQFLVSLMAIQFRAFFYSISQESGFHEFAEHVALPMMSLFMVESIAINKSFRYVLIQVRCCTIENQIWS